MIAGFRMIVVAGDAVCFLGGCMIVLLCLLYYLDLLVCGGLLFISVYYLFSLFVVCVITLVCLDLVGWVFWV